MERDYKKLYYETLDEKIYYLKRFNFLLERVISLNKLVDKKLQIYKNNKSLYEIKGEECRFLNREIQDLKIISSELEDTISFVEGK